MQRYRHFSATRAAALLLAAGLALALELNSPVLAGPELAAGYHSAVADQGFFRRVVRMFQRGPQRTIHQWKKRSISEQDIPASLADLRLEDAATSYEQRYFALQSYAPLELEPQAEVLLMAGVAGRWDTPLNRHDESHLSVKNEALALLVRKGQHPARLLELMEALINDPNQSPVWREYVLQHTEALYERLVSEAGDRKNTSKLKRKIRRLLGRCLAAGDSGLCGTALLVSHRLAALEPEMADKFIYGCARQVLAQHAGHSHLTARISAFQVLTDAGDAQVLPMSFQVLEDEQSDPCLVLVAARAAVAHRQHQAADLQELVSQHRKLKRLTTRPQAQQDLQRLKRKYGVTP